MADSTSRISGLSPAKRALLARRLAKKRRPASPGQTTSRASRPQPLAGDELTAHLDYWRGQLDGGLPARPLPADHRPPRRFAPRPARRRFALAAKLCGGLQELCRRADAEFSDGLLAAVVGLCHRYTGSRRVVVGSVFEVAAPEATAPGEVNLLPLSTRVEGRWSAGELVAQVRETVAGARAHHALPFEQLAEALGLEVQMRQAPLLQVLWTFGEATSFSPGEIFGELPRADLMLWTRPAGDAIEGFVDYDPRCFDTVTVGRFVEHLKRFLSAMVAGGRQPISALPLLTAAQRHQLRVEWVSPPSSTAGGTTLNQLFEAQVARWPEVPALTAGGRSLTYRQLDRQANRWAHHLRRRGVGPEARVAMCAGDFAETIAAVLGVLKAGGVCLPLDPEAERATLAGARWLVAPASLTHCGMGSVERLDFESVGHEIAGESAESPSVALTAGHLACVQVASSGLVAPIALTHGALLNTLERLGAGSGCGPRDAVLTDVGLLAEGALPELLWPLMLGAHMLCFGDDALEPSPRPARQGMQFSLFFFTGDGGSESSDRYRLVLDSTRFADRHGFTAVWTPERHFDPFGGLFPNPSILSAALAMITERIHIRAGSVVVPLHHPVRVAEEWALVDNLSHGRVGIAFASGWHPNDFVFSPEAYADRRQETQRAIETFLKLWQGDSMGYSDGVGNPVEVRSFPRPVQRRPPLWLTTGGSPDTFARAGKLGISVLTNLLGQDLENVERNIGLYREALVEHGHDPQTGHVTIMLHAFLGEDPDLVREQVRGPFCEYLRGFTRLLENMAKSMGSKYDRRNFSDDDMDDLLAFAFDRYFNTAALFGTPSSCTAMIEQLQAIGVDEVACLIDFGIEENLVLDSLHHLDELRRLTNVRRDQATAALLETLREEEVSILSLSQRTMRRLLPEGAGKLEACASLRTIRDPGVPPEAPAAWTSAAEPPGRHDGGAGGPPWVWGQRVLDRHLREVPIGVAGSLCSSGSATPRGVLDRAGSTAEHFVPDPFSARPGGRLARSEIRARRHGDGTLELRR